MATYIFSMLLYNLNALVVREDREGTPPLSDAIIFSQIL